MRMALGASTSTRAMMMLKTDDPSTAMMAKPRMMPGKAMKASTKRCTDQVHLAAEVGADCAQEGPDGYADGDADQAHEQGDSPAVEEAAEHVPA